MSSELDLSAFNSRWLKTRSWLSQRLLLVAILLTCLVVLASYYNALPGVVFMVSLFVWTYLWLFSSNHLPGNAFAYRNHLNKFFMRHNYDWGFIYTQYHSMARSTFNKHEDFVWSLPVGGIEVALMFTDDGGCLAWFQLAREFPHIVVDSLADNHRFHRQWSRRRLPPEQVQLEGDFPDYFHVYQDAGQQVMTLQILAPDRMLYLVDNLREFNLEIQDNYLRLFAAHAQRSAKDFQAFLDALTSLGKGLKVARLNAIKD